MNAERDARRARLRAELERAHERYMAIDLDSPEIRTLEILIPQIEDDLDALYRADEIENAELVLRGYTCTWRWS